MSNETARDDIRRTETCFCHGCGIEFQNNSEVYRCPHCESDFVEVLPQEAASSPADPPFSLSDFFNSLNPEQAQQVDRLRHMSNVLGAALPNQNQNNAGTPSQTLLDMLVSLAGSVPAAPAPARGNTRASRAAGNTAREATLGANSASTTDTERASSNSGSTRRRGGSNARRVPFLLVGGPSETIFGHNMNTLNEGISEGLNMVVSQILAQFEGPAPPPLSAEQLGALPSESITQEHPNRGQSCPVCWEDYEIDQSVTRLPCEHIFHGECILQWLRLHASCPVCRRSLAPPGAPHAPRVRLVQAAPARAFSIPGMAQQLFMRRNEAPATGGLTTSTSTSSMTTDSSVTTGGRWSVLSRSSTHPSSGSRMSDGSTTSFTTSGSEPQYNMDIDYD